MNAAEVVRRMNATLDEIVLRVERIERRLRMAAARVDEHRHTGQWNSVAPPPRSRMH
jgi:hypothetical protein